ncbi:hypothetical protein XH88_36200 [Bradyrhizobium sp. CCBAU 51627]|nr:hypothetical protein [Bradyrhizobium sp. CCBAU 51627]
MPTFALPYGRRLLWIILLLLVGSMAWRHFGGRERFVMPRAAFQAALPSLMWLTISRAGTK